MKKVGDTAPNNLFLFFNRNIKLSHRGLVTIGWTSKYQQIASAFSVKGTLTILGSNETIIDTKAKNGFKNKIN